MGQLEKRTLDLEGGSDDKRNSLNSDKEKNDGDLEEAKTLLEDATRLHQSALNEAKQLKDMSEKCNAELQAHLDKEGKVSVNHLLAAHQAYVAFGETAKRSTSVMENVMDGWGERLEIYAEICEFISETPTLAWQKKLAWKLRKMVKSNKVKLLSLICEASSLPSLALPTSVPNKVREQIYDQPAIVVD